MSDDIVTRLRGKRTEFDNWLNDCEGKYSFGHDESIWSDAADEIERLRADRDKWRNWAEEFFYTEPDCECPLCDQVRAAIGKTI